jgi:putative membrane protein
MKNRTYSVYFASIVFCMAGASTQVLAAPDQENRGTLSRSDYDFAVTAATGGSFEVAAGRIAAARGTSPSVKQFGEQMVNDHSKAADKLKDIVTSAGGALPAQPTAKQQKELDRLNTLNGSEFDKEYAALMVEDHKKDLKEFQKAAKRSDNYQLKSFAGETAQTVEHHLAMAKTLEDEIKGNASRSAK